mgnify:CR=1 FL=1
MDDNELVLRIRQGDLGAFNQLRLHYRALFLVPGRDDIPPFGWPSRYCQIRLLGSHRQGVESLYDWVMLRVLAPSAYTPAKGSFRAYLGRALRNAVIDLNETVTADRERLVPLEAGGPDDEGIAYIHTLEEPSPDTPYLAAVNELRQLVRDEIRNIPDDQKRDVLWRHWTLGQSFRQIQAETRVPRATAVRWYQEFCLHLRRFLDDLGIEYEE